MDSEHVAIAVAALLAAGYALWVAVLVARAKFYSPGQKVAQISLALLVPVVGPAVVHAMFRAHIGRPPKVDRHFVPNRSQDPDNAFASGRYLDSHD